MFDEKVNTLEQASVLEVKDKVEKEMKLVEASEFEGIVAEEIKTTDLEEMYALASEMVKFAAARGGVGLTLPQIGINKRAFVFLEGEDQWQMFLNPEYFGNGKKAMISERSLSYDGIYALPRYKKINAVYYVLDVDKKTDTLTTKRITRMMSGFRAYLFQMLVDVLNGKTARIIGTFINTEKKENGEKQ